MVVTGMIIEGREVEIQSFDTRRIVEDVFSSDEKSFKEQNNIVVGRVPLDFVCKGRCDACVYRNVVARRVR